MEVKSIGLDDYQDVRKETVRVDIEIILWFWANMISSRELASRQLDGKLWADDLCHSGCTDCDLPVRQPSGEAYNPSELVRQTLSG